MTLFLPLPTPSNLVFLNIMKLPKRRTEKRAASPRNSDDILFRILDATEDIRTLLRQGAGQEGMSNEGRNETVPQLESQVNAVQEESRPATSEPQATTIAGRVNPVDETTDHWPDPETIERYKARWALHARECERMDAELNCFAAHLTMIGGDRTVIENTESVRKQLFEATTLMNMALDATSCDRREALIRVTISFESLLNLVFFLDESLHKKDALISVKLAGWTTSFFHVNNIGVKNHIVDNKLGNYLEHVHSVFYPNVEAAMIGVIDSLMIFEEKSINELLAVRKTEDMESWCKEYIKCVSPPASASTRPEREKRLASYKEQFTVYRKSCSKMQEELDHLISHYRIIAMDEAVFSASDLLQRTLLEPIKSVERALAAPPNKLQVALYEVIVSLAKLHTSVVRFQKSLYHQKHAFYFGKVKKWAAFIANGLSKVIVIRRNPDFLFDYICYDLLLGLTSEMTGVTHMDSPKEQEPSAYKMTIVDEGNVADELKRFAKESLPRFLVDQMERDTTRYINLTTIATFFSSVTATTLQFTYIPLQSEASNSLRGLVNLFWFLSLVFSVSSGVNSLLGLTWRKSSIYNSRVPPELIGMWFEKVPMLSLVIAAVAFVIGLNLFAYLSFQPQYVALATNIFTGLHGICLLTATAWFIYQLKYESIWARWIRIAMKSIALTKGWIRQRVMKRIWQTIKHPYHKFEKSLHTQRNVYWAFRDDHRVADLNLSIYNLVNYRDCPGPHPLSKIVRCIVYATKKYSLWMKRAIFTFYNFVHSLVCQPSDGRHELSGQSNLGMLGPPIRWEEDGSYQLLPNIVSQADVARELYLSSLQQVFGGGQLIQSIMTNIRNWEVYGDLAMPLQDILSRLLWGYPELLVEFQEQVKPVLEAARNQRETERREREEQLRGTSPKAPGNNNDPPHFPSSDLDHSREVRRLESPQVITDDVNDANSGPTGQTHPDKPIMSDEYHMSDGQLRNPEGANSSPRDPSLPEEPNVTKLESSALVRDGAEVMSGLMDEGIARGSHSGAER